MQRVEGVEELLLNPLLAGKELDIINQQHVGLPVLFAEFHQLILLNRGDVLVGEFLGGHVGNLGGFLGGHHVLTHCVQ